GSRSGTPSRSAAPRRRAAWREAPHPCQQGTSDGRSLNNLIRPPQQGRRDRQAEGSGGLEVDDELELRRLLHRQVGGLRALEDPVDVAGCAPQHVRVVRSVNHAPAFLGEVAIREDPWEVMRRGIVDDPRSIEKKKAIRYEGKPLDASQLERRKGTIQVIRSFHLYAMECHSQGLCGALRVLP